MTDRSSSAAYCSDLVRQADEHRWLATRYASPERRERLIALYALHHEVRRVPAAVSEPPLGEIRLQWWRDAVAEIAAGEVKRAHPVVEHVAATQCVHAGNRAAIDAAIDARAHLLYGDVFSSADAAFDWLMTAEGYLADARAVGEIAQPVRDRLVAAEAAFVAAHEAVDVAAPFEAELEARAGAEHAALKAALNVGHAAIPNEAFPDQLHLSLIPIRLGDDGPFTPLRVRLALFKAMASGVL
ncbi:MAG: squalene/phytoene synthase family protein [Pseudomonadota bacterium]